MSRPFSGQRALITGASAGLGEEFARQLAAEGVAVLTLTARRRDRLEALQAALRVAHPGLRVEVVAADLAEPGGVDALLAHFAATGEAVDLLINNAGFGDIGTFESSAPERSVAMLNLNVVALTRLTRWVLPGMLERRSGWICNVGSTAGMLPLPTFAVYAATKAYVNSFSEAVRAEVHGSGVAVTALCPGPVETEFGQAAARPDGERKFGAPNALYVEAAEVVRDALHSLERGGGRVIPGLLVRTLVLFLEAVPRVVLRAVFNASSGQFQRERAKRHLPPPPPPPAPLPPVTTESPLAPPISEPPTAPDLPPLPDSR